MIGGQLVGTERGKVMSWSGCEAIFHIWRMTGGDGILGYLWGRRVYQTNIRGWKSGTPRSRFQAASRRSW